MSRLVVFAASDTEGQAVGKIAGSNELAPNHVQKR